MPHWEQPEPCKMSVKSVHEWIKIVCDGWMDEYETLCEKICVCGENAPLLSNWSEFYWKADNLDD